MGEPSSVYYHQAVSMGGRLSVADDEKKAKETKKPLELLIMAVLGLLTVLALLLILTDLQGWI